VFWEDIYVCEDLQLHSEDRGSKVHRNVGMLPQNHTVSQLRRSRFESSPSCETPCLHERALNDRVTAV